MLPMSYRPETLAVHAGRKTRQRHPTRGPCRSTRPGLRLRHAEHPATVRTAQARKHLFLIMNPTSGSSKPGSTPWMVASARCRRPRRGCRHLRGAEPDLCGRQHHRALHLYGGTYALFANRCRSTASRSASSTRKPQELAQHVDDRPTRVRLDAVQSEDQVIDSRCMVRGPARAMGSRSSLTTPPPRRSCASRSSTERIVGACGDEVHRGARQPRWVANRRFGSSSTDRPRRAVPGP